MEIFYPTQLHIQLSDTISGYTSHFAPEHLCVFMKVIRA